MGKMVEIQNININDMVKNEDGTFENEIRLSPIKQINSKNLASESELHRILIHLNQKTEGEEPEKNKSGYTIIPSYFTLDVGKNVRRYDKLIECDGEVVVTNQEYVLDEDGNKVLDEDNHYKLKIKDQNKYISMFCGAGHSRVRKSLFVHEDVCDRLNDILLCGMPHNLVYDRPSKWNAYYAMVSTDSTPVSYMPNIVVVNDYERTIKQKSDIVEVYGKGDKKFYNPIGHKGMKHHKEPIKILPFDGAGLVTPECGLKWAKELKCQSRKGKFYLPSCFQFRAIPGVKGELMVFDLKQFSKEKKVSKIVDLGGRVWDIFEDRIDVILTASQFKFWKQYLDSDGKFDYWIWRKEFDRECHGYKRKFNIVSYGVYPDDLPQMTMLSYQPEQSVNFTEEEIPLASSMGIGIYKKVVSNISEFLKYRGLIEISGETGEEIEDIDRYTPPYYIALLHNKDLFYDEYVHGKIEEDIKKLKNNILSGKLFVKGNYQVFIPDLYGLAEWAFHDELGYEPHGLLRKPYHIYSGWWNERGADTVDIMRNPAVGMEHRIGHLRNNRELKKWFKYQTTGIVTGMYDTLALALNGADYDGDTVCTTDNKQLIDAVRREFKAGNGRIVVKKVIDKAPVPEPKKGIQIADRKSLMKVNQMSFKNSIGSVIDRVTDLWSCVNTDEKRVRDYIMIGVIVGSETIDFAKTGENASFPKEIKNFFKGCKKGYWMRYLLKNQTDANRERRALNRASTDREIERVTKFKDYDCNMNRLCRYAEKEIRDINIESIAKMDTVEYKFDYRQWMLRSTPHINRKIYRMVKVLQKEYQEISKTYRDEYINSKTQKEFAVNKFRWFYERCRVELLTLEPDIDRLIDMLVIIYYGDKNSSADFLTLQKDILWNAFPKEMIARCTEKEIDTNIDLDMLEKRHKMNVEYAKRQKEKRADRKKVMINSIENFDEYRNRQVILTKEDRMHINSLLDNEYRKKLVRKDNVIKLKRILAMLIYLSRKYEDTEKQSLKWIKKLDNVPNEVTDLTLGRLTDVNHKYMEKAIMFFSQMGIVESKIISGGIKFKVLFPHYDGEIWFEGDDYNKAGSMIRDYFRN